MKFHPYSIFYPKDNTHLFQINKRSFLSIFLSFSLSFSLATPDLQLIFPINLDNKHSSEITSDNARRNTTKTELVSISNNTTTGKYHVVNLYPGRMFLVSFSNVAPTMQRYRITPLRFVHFRLFRASIGELENLGRVQERGNSSCFLVEICNIGITRG